MSDVKRVDGEFNPSFNHVTVGKGSGGRKREVRKCFVCGFDSRNNIVCEDCGELVCKNHWNRGSHKCDDKVPGVHSIWRRG